ncbi:alpha/beta fold hydrolase [Sphingopyxis granuli]|uniref:alpha/beta fold hydrolase n=1 Tax=Sphingopyxis granuli TaxID=267128 RepID=UPI000830D307|nr:alpha/beta fold hydrolase [Sphingopyxis granuli]
MADAGYLDTGDGHELYWQASGQADGMPCLVIHGGPGAGSSASVRALFDPARTRLIQFDQRGAGRSKPSGSLDRNTTFDLVADIERLRTHLGIDRWHVFAGSWGTTLALLYAAAHRAHCRGLILRGITEWTPKKYQWALDGRRFLAPRAHAYLMDLLTLEERKEPVAAYYRRIMAGEREACKRWHLYEKQFAYPCPRGAVDDEALLAPDFEVRARIHIHYWYHNAFLEPGTLEAATDRLGDLPVVIVQGALDLMCPPIFAQRLAARLPHADFHLIAGGGHAADHPPIAAALHSVLAEAGLARPLHQDRTS